VSPHVSGASGNVLGCGVGLVIGTDSGGRLGVPSRGVGGIVSCAKSTGSCACWYVWVCGDGLGGVLCPVPPRPGRDARIVSPLLSP
jgi:hypothetical protein